MPSTHAKPRGDSRSSSPKPNSNNPAGGFGLMFILLAAMSRDYATDQALNPNPECHNMRPNMATAANLRYCASFLEERMKRAAEQLSDVPESEAVEGDAERRRRKLKPGRWTPDSDEESADITSSRGLTSNTDELASSFSSVEITHSTLSTCDDAALSHVLSYLSVKDVAAVRSVNRRFHCLAQVAMPLQNGMLFLRFEEETHRGKRFEVAPHRHVLRWNCGYCSTPNTVGIASCRHCGGSADEGYGMRRVFFGQLRKERTAELVAWLIAQVTPEVEVFHIENHTSSPDGRGKGCAWVYITNPQDEQRLIELNKRMFVDIDDDRREGVWFCRKEATEELNYVAASHAYKPQRPIVLPRQPLVVERPQGRAPSASAKEPSARRWTRLPKGRTAQDLYEENAGSQHSLRMGYSAPVFSAHPTTEYELPPLYVSPPCNTTGHGYRFVDPTHYVHDPYSALAVTWG